MVRGLTEDSAMSKIVGIVVERADGTSVTVRAPSSLILASDPRLLEEVPFEKMRSTRNADALRNTGLKTFGDIIVGDHGLGVLERAPNVGRRIMGELREFMCARGLSFDMIPISLEGE